MSICDSDKDVYVSWNPDDCVDKENNQENEKRVRNKRKHSAITFDSQCKILKIEKNGKLNEMYILQNMKCVSQNQVLFCRR